MVPEVNIGLVGHVDHGKSTLTQSLTGKWPDTHSEEMKRGITIRLGYADATFYKCKKCETPKCYGTTKKCPVCFSDTEPIRTISLVDAPGHKTLMATVLSATSIMDGALMIIAADEECPQPQTEEHLKALDIVGIENIVIVQNKIDKVSQEEAEENYKQIKEFVKGTCAEDAPIIPISASQRVNIDVLIEAIEKNIPTPERDTDTDPKMLVARSFDVNRPGTPIDKLKGGVIGGSLLEGTLKVGDEIVIKPGEKTDGKYKPVRTKITGLQKVNKDLGEAGAGGLLAVRTELDPFLTKSDSLSGSIVGLPDKLPDLTDEITLDVNLLEYMVGLKENKKEVDKIKTGEPLMMTIGTTKTAGAVTSARPNDGKQEIEVKLKLPICADKGDRIAISRRI
ncbi:MAG: translation initiation factor IF-2 subunit gamma, partial [Candidatus Aenigmatarchaeota archaeon]